jgi:hypothetical protein
MKTENLIYKDLKNLYKTDYLAWHETTLLITIPNLQPSLL